MIWISGKEHYKLHLEKNPNIIDGMKNYNTHIKPKMIYQFYRDGEYIQCFENANEAHRATGVCARNILQVANREKRNRVEGVIQQVDIYGHLKKI